MLNSQPDVVEPLVAMKNVYQNEYFHHETVVAIVPTAVSPSR